MSFPRGLVLVIALVVPAAGSATADGDGPPVLWSRALGGGSASIVGDGERLYTAYRDGDDEVAIAMRANDGTTIWERRFPAPIPESEAISTRYGRGPDATPLLVGDRIVMLGFMGHLRCIDTKRGRLIWSHDLGTTFDVTTPRFGHASSPRLVGDTVVVEAGGVLAFDLKSGEIAWQNRELDRLPVDPTGRTQPEVSTLIGTTRYVRDGSRIVALDVSPGRR